MALSRQIPFLLILSILTLSGCGGSQEAKPVAIVDMDTVLKMTGLDLELSKLIQFREKQLLANLNGYQQQLEERFAAKKEEFGEEPTAEQQQELQLLFNQLNTQNEKIKAATQQDLQAFQQKVYQGFQEKVNSVCMDLAKERGHEIVLAKSAQILAYSNTIDITDAVVEGVKALKDQTAGEATAEGGAPTSPGTTPTIPGMTPSTDAPIAPPINPNASAIPPAVKSSSPPPAGTADAAPAAASTKPATTSAAPVGTSE